MIKIDVSAHILPGKYFEALCKKAPSQVSMWSGNPALSQIDVRLRVLEMYPDVMQVLTVATPPLETLVTASDAIELAKIANDEMAEIIAKYPNKFLSAFACLPLNDVDASIKEADRAITKLHFRGVEIHSNINGEPLDAPKFKPLYKRMSQHDLPIWIHPVNKPKPAAGDLVGTPVYSLGWPFETTVAMGILAQSGVFEDCPNIKFITHHCGGMIPYFSRRLAMGGSWKREVMGEERTRVLANFHKFYADTAVYGNTSALMCGYAYFGADHMLFGTDTPLGGGEAKGGYLCTEETIRSIEQMEVPALDKEKIFRDNIRAMLRVEPY